jgi:hypothetical protein
LVYRFGFLVDLAQVARAVDGIGDDARIVVESSSIGAHERADGREAYSVLQTL